jgi:hypothetical protein
MTDREAIIERAAKAMYAQSGGSDLPWSDVVQTVREAFLALARAAVDVIDIPGTAWLAPWELSSDVKTAAFEPVFRWMCNELNEIAKSRRNEPPMDAELAAMDSGYRSGLLAYSSDEFTEIWRAFRDAHLAKPATDAS